MGGPHLIRGALKEALEVRARRTGREAFSRWPGGKRAAKLCSTGWGPRGRKGWCLESRASVLQMQKMNILPTSDLNVLDIGRGLEPQTAPVGTFTVA